MANGQDQKLTNSIQILNELRTGPKSRSSLSRKLNIQPSTVTYSINRLMELNFVSDSKLISPDSRSRGRKSTQLILNNKAGVVFGVDLLVDRFIINICYIDRSEYLVIKEYFDDVIITAKKGSDERFFQCLNYVLSLIETKCANTKLYGGCISVAAIIGSDERSIIKSLTHGISNLDVKDCLLKRDYVIFIENDANCAAYRYIKYKNDSFVYSLARLYDAHSICEDAPQLGVGIGIIAHGKMNKGWNSKSGEFSNFMYQEGKQNRQLECSNELLQDMVDDPCKLHAFLDNYLDKLLFTNALLNPRTIYLGGDNKIWKDQIVEILMKDFHKKSREDVEKNMCFTFLTESEGDVAIGASYYMLDFLFELPQTNQSMLSNHRFESPLFKEILKK
ncbi:MAG: ArsR family transcriptional regulator [Sphaerochaeta sp.]